MASTRIKHFLVILFLLANTLILVICGTLSPTNIHLNTNMKSKYSLSSYCVTYEGEYL